MTQPEMPSSAPVSGSETSTSAGEIRVKLFARTDVGQIREHNEDNFLVADLTRKSRGLLEANRSGAVGPHGSIFAVCDGMGDEQLPAKSQVSSPWTFYERMGRGLQEGHALSQRARTPPRACAIEAAGLRIFSGGQSRSHSPWNGDHGVFAAALVDDHLFSLRLETRGYLLAAVPALTRDQSLVNQLIEAGQLTEEEAETFEHNNIILQALGTADTVQVDLTFCELRRGDRVLLCSDGLSGMVRFEDIREALRATPEPIDVCKSLTERAPNCCQGGTTTSTVIVAEFDGEGLPAPDSDADPLKYRKCSLPEETPENTQ